MIASYYVQLDTDSIRGRCTANHMNSNVSKTRVISFTKKTNVISFQYKICG
jgi:hypothetical protein